MEAADAEPWANNSHCYQVIPELKTKLDWFESDIEMFNPISNFEYESETVCMDVESTHSGTYAYGPWDIGQAFLQVVHHIKAYV